MKLVNMLNITIRTAALVFAAFMACAGNSFAQRTCGSMEILEMQIQEDPKRGETLNQVEAHTLAIETSGEQFFKIPTADWPEGTYIFYLRSKDGSAARRFIIQR